jgi:valyl-tRNA synthetase
MTTSEHNSLPKNYEFSDVESKWLSRWEEHDSFTARMDEDRPSYSIVIPPPNVTGVLHVGHALNNTLQDILVRYKRMDGYNTLWVPGTDHAGIATQNVVERQLGAEGKSRHDVGRDQFVERVWEWRREKGGAIITQLKRLGCSCDWSRERFTMDEGLSRAVREVFVRLYHEGLIYKGDYIVNWCPRCLTALADDEVDHEERAGKLYHVRYPLADGSGALVVATTRPETMLGDTGVAVHPDDERYAHLSGAMVDLPLIGRRIPIVFDTHVQREFGTGALKVTPSHDRDDYEIGLRHNLERCKVMDEHGVMNEQAGVYAGLDRFECRVRVVDDLRAQGLLVDIEEHEHAVGLCYRCKAVVEPTTSLQWFVAVKPLAEAAVSAVRDDRITIYPKNWYNTFYHWMDNIRDWCISRQIWWGHRIPAWNCAACGEVVVAVTDPTVCPACGSSELIQETDVLDTWFSSALWPFSTMGWPENTRELRFFYPTSVLITSFDILFFWVARMMMMGIHFMEEVPFRDVYLHALVRDKDGKKMSKSTGNVIDPLAVMDRYGTDALRFTLIAFAAQGREIRLDEERIDGYRHFINKLWNASRFALMHVDDQTEVDLVDHDDIADLPLIHRWILGRSSVAVGGVRTALDNYHFNEAASVIYQFTWREFCDWYVEWIKADLFSDDQDVRKQARAVLLHVLETIVKLIHPITPFVSEEIWAALPGHREVLMTRPFPQENLAWQDRDVEDQMRFLMGIITAIRTIRAETGVHPSRAIEAAVYGADENGAALLAQFGSAIGDMCRLSELRINPQQPAPREAARSIFATCEIVVPLAGLVDVAAERDKLDRERAKIERELATVEGKLANQQFLMRAPEAAVAKQRDKQTELNGRLAKITEAEERLAALSS